MIKIFNNPKTWAWLLVVILAALLIFFAPGCEVFKHYKSNHADSTSVKKTTVAATTESNGVAVSKDSSKKKEEYEWFRIIQQFAARPKDTVTNNNYYTMPAQPATIIYEGGKGKSEEQKSSYDSTAFNALFKMMGAMQDSMAVMKEQVEVTNHSETKGVGITTIVVIVIAGLVALKLLGWGASKFKIVKV